MFHRTKGVDSPGDHDIAPANVTSPAAFEAGTRSTRMGNPALIGVATRVTGDMTGEEDLHIEGCIMGCVTFKRHTVSIDTDGLVEGDVVAQSLIVGGTIRGRLIASGSVRVLAGARVSGEIHAPALVIEEGAEFQGAVDMNPDNPLLEQLFDDARVDDMHQTSNHTWQASTADADDDDEGAEVETFDESEAPSSR